MGAQAKRRLSADYDSSSLEPNVDPEKAVAFLNAGAVEPSAIPVSETSSIRPADPWRSRTIRARESTLQLFDIIEAGQRTKRAKRDLPDAEPATVQELADLAICLLAEHLGYEPV